MDSDIGWWNQIGVQWRVDQAVPPGTIIAFSTPQARSGAFYQAYLNHRAFQDQLLLGELRPGTVVRLSLLDHIQEERP